MLVLPRWVPAVALVLGGRRSTRGHQKPGMHATEPRSDHPNKLRIVSIDAQRPRFLLIRRAAAELDGHLRSLRAHIGAPLLQLDSELSAERRIFRDVP